MKIQTILDYLDSKFPFCSAAEYDNVGLLVGDETADFESAVLALDCTDFVIDRAIEQKAQLIICHHPVIFSGIKSISFETKIAKLIKNGISVISIHTNLDIADKGVCHQLAKKLCLTEIGKTVGYDGLTFRHGKLKEKMSSDQFASFVSEKLNASVKYVAGKEVEKVAVCSGSGGDYVNDIYKDFDAFVTSEVKHHQFLFAKEKGITLIDAGHFATEDIVIEPLKEILSKEFPEVRFITEHFSPVKEFKK